MDNMFRVCIAGRFFDIPTHEVAPATLEALKAITDTSNTINPRDLLCAFLESYEIKTALESSIAVALQKLQDAKNSN
ncbi:hypothetical protein [Helicobacter turcicus]|uniref:Phage protein n=1 Tax=Helicobacter turcicus TaxID=2867412 RepID=A0ABS7JNY8_9HELI|nr:hypothetical protein [Helicobacter turcicus]MBX7491116.1 hypothetical protein [Helicobacter turcicus]MBX7545980.1 hypothetical protein [Helicobacter turcicus]